MTVEHIFTSPLAGGDLAEQEHITVVAGAGIVGDRYFDRHEEPGQNITLIEAEEIEAFYAEHDRPSDLAVTRRNLVIRGVRVSELIGREFLIGDVRLRGAAFCEPCMVVGTAMATPELPAAQVVKRFLHRAGIRADVLSDGIIACGASITLAD